MIDRNSNCLISNYKLETSYLASKMGFFNSTANRLSVLNCYIPQICDNIASHIGNIKANSNNLKFLSIYSNMMFGIIKIHQTQVNWLYEQATCLLHKNFNSLRVSLKRSRSQSLEDNKRLKLSSKNYCSVLDKPFDNITDVQEILNELDQNIENVEPEPIICKSFNETKQFDAYNRRDITLTEAYQDMSADQAEIDTFGRASIEELQFYLETFDVVSNPNQSDSSEVAPVLGSLENNHSVVKSKNQLRGKRKNLAANIDRKRLRSESINNIINDDNSAVSIEVVRNIETSSHTRRCSRTSNQMHCSSQQTDNSLNNKLPLNSELDTCNEDGIIENISYNPDCLEQQMLNVRTPQICIDTKILEFPALLNANLENDCHEISPTINKQTSRKRSIDIVISDICSKKRKTQKVFMDAEDLKVLSAEQLIMNSTNYFDTLRCTNPKYNIYDLAKTNNYFKKPSIKFNRVNKLLNLFERNLKCSSSANVDNDMLNEVLGVELRKRYFPNENDSPHLPVPALNGLSILNHLEDNQGAINNKEHVNKLTTKQKPSAQSTNCKEELRKKLVTAWKNGKVINMDFVNNNIQSRLEAASNFCLILELASEGFLSLKKKTQSHSIAIIEMGFQLKKSLKMI